MLREEDFTFGKVALNQGFISKEQLEECILILQARRENGEEKKLEDVALENHIISEEDLFQIYHLLGRNKIGSYEIVKKIAKGSTSTIYEAIHLENQNKATLKVLLPKLTVKPEFLQRFLLEGKALVQFEHPNIIHAYEVKRDGDKFFIAMEIFEGTSLSSFLRENGTLGEEFALEIALQIAKALDYIHQYKIIHRDVKPENVMINQGGMIKLLDLGLAKKMGDATITADGVIMGTPFYISPEQIHGDKDIDHRADIYSWGATLFHIVTGRPPFVGNHPTEVLGKHLKSPPISPKQLIPSLSTNISNFILRTLEKDREKRFGNFKEVIQDLQSILRPDLNVVRETYESSIHEELLKKDESSVTLNQVNDQKNKDQETSYVKAVKTPQKSLNLFGKVKNELFQTRWELMILLILISIVGGGGFFSYKIYMSSSKNKDVDSYLKIAKKNIGDWEISKLHSSLKTLYKRKGTNVLEEDLEDLFVLLKEKFRKLSGELLKKYQGLEDLKILQSKELLQVYLFFKVFGKEELAKKCDLEIELSKTLIYKIEEKQIKIYLKKMKDYLEKRAYLKASFWLEKNIKSISSPYVHKEIKNYSKQIPFFLQLWEKFKKQVEVAIQNKRGILELYFEQGEVLKIQIIEWKKKELTYMVKKIEPFKLDKKGAVKRESQKLIIEHKAVTTSLEKIFSKLHLVSFIKIGRWRRNYEAILKFLLQEKQNFNRDVLIQMYFRQSKKSHTKLSNLIYKEVTEIVQSRLDYATKKLFSMALTFLWEQKEKESREKLQFLVKNFPESSWLIENQNSIEACYFSFKILKTLQQRKWKQVKKQVQELKNNYGPSEFLKRSQDEYKCILLFVQSKINKISWNYKGGRDIINKFLKQYSHTKIFPSLALEGLLDLAIHSIGQNKSFQFSEKDKRFISGILLGISTDQDRKDSFYQDIQSLTDFGKQYFQIFQSSYQDIPKNLVLLEKLENNMDHIVFFPYYILEIKALKLLGKGRMEMIKGNHNKANKSFQTLLESYKKTDFIKAYSHIIQSYSKIHGQLYPQSKNRIQVVYDFVNPQEIIDWEGEGWGMLDGKFSFLLANEEEFRQKPLGFQHQRLKIFQKLEKWKITLVPSDQFSFFLSISGKNLLFFHFQNQVYLREGLSVERYMEKKKDLSFLAKGSKMIFSSFQEGKPIFFTLSFSSKMKLKVQKGGQQYKKTIGSSPTVKNFYIWLTLGSGIKKVEYVGELSP